MNCWFTEWRRHGMFPEGGQGNLFRVVADSDRVERYDGVLPQCALWPDGELLPEEDQLDRCWTWAEALPGRQRCLFAMGHLSGEDERL